MEESASTSGKKVLFHIVQQPPPEAMSGEQLSDIGQHQSAVIINIPTDPENSGYPFERLGNEEGPPIFSIAQVSVTIDYLACIPGDKNVFFTNLCASMDLTFGNDSDNTVTLRGTWAQIVLTERVMKAHFSSWRQQALAREAYASLKEKSVEESSEESASNKTDLRTTGMKTRRQTKLTQQQEESPKRQSDIDAQPRENKENEVHLRIAVEQPAIAGTITESVQHPESTTLYQGDVAEPSKTSGAKPKKNYELLAPYKFFCNICSFKTKRESHYVTHLKKHDKTSDLYTCDTCNFRTMRLGHLRRHELVHSENMLTCSLCQYKTDDQRLLTKHSRLKHPDVVQIPKEPAEVLTCAQCGYATTKTHLYQRHVKAHDTSTSVRKHEHTFQCEECPYNSSRKEHYMRHINNVHQNRRPFLCDLCGKAFKRPDALKQHRITHAEMDPSVPVFRCTVCNKGCRSQAHLNEHLAVHSNVRAFLCEVCGQSFKTRSVQRKHVLTIHKNPHAFSCHRCQRKFNTKYALRRHIMKQHSWLETVIVESDAAPESNAMNGHTITVEVPQELLVTLPEGAVPVPLQFALKKEEVTPGSEVITLQMQPSDGPARNAAEDHQLLESNPQGTQEIVYTAVVL